MTPEASFTDAALRQWKQQADRTAKILHALSDEQLQQPVAPGKNRLSYLFGHLLAINDAMLPLLGLGARQHPELDAIYLAAPDRTQPQTLAAAELKQQWDQNAEALWTAFNTLTPAQWLERHTAVSEEDFAREPHRNRFAILLGRTAHLAYHAGQIKLV
ncbi:DinB family protein [Granulicella tundricola]|uniref:DinB-like domain-containing protein n=1 Tax=Granulicella tundricola (strain ATCC BAA-1859 / DSM 23138 / MP5ACTX9) TaxID=1198114 RepID=E8X4E8_GRATM|nr:DinB family protein [Granulicella tundricola]ADW68275.1 hypothetical protein AciX9_1212 [Granulicella tundricola MP5ACTX9]